MDKLLEWLETSDFYSAPCSTKYHLAEVGGLAKHTWNVMQCAVGLNKKYASEGTDGLFPQESVVLAAFAHDLCKVNFYSVDEEAPTDAQVQYLRSLCLKTRVPVPEKVNKSYASICIDHLKSMKPLPLPSFTPGFTVKDQLPLGHGEKSLYVVSQFVTLTLDEALAIRWHMGGYDVSVQTYIGRLPYDEAVKQSKLVTILNLADIEATFLVEA